MMSQQEIEAFVHRVVARIENENDEPDRLAIDFNKGLNKVYRGFVQAILKEGLTVNVYTRDDGSGTTVSFVIPVSFTTRVAQPPVTTEMGVEVNVHFPLDGTIHLWLEEYHINERMGIHHPHGLSDGSICIANDSKKRVVKQLLSGKYQLAILILRSIASTYQLTGSLRPPPGEVSPISNTLLDNNANLARCPTCKGYVTEAEARQNFTSCPICFRYYCKFHATKQECPEHNEGGDA